MAAMGWTLEKTVSASRSFMSSTGEDGTHMKGWMDIQLSGNNVIFYAYQWINTATNTGYGGAYQTTTINNLDCSGAYYLNMYGSKDTVLISFGTTISTAYKYFGHVAYPLTTGLALATTANAEAAGAGVVIEVDNTNNFKVGDYTQIVDPNAGMRERFLVTAVNPGVSITGTLVNAYGTGSQVGYCPSNFWISWQGQRGTYLVPTCPAELSGSGNGLVGSSRWCDYGSMGNGAPDYRNNRYTMGRCRIVGVSGNESTSQTSIGYSDTNFGEGYNTGSVINDIWLMTDPANPDENGTATSGGNTTMDNAAAPWVVDALIGKILVITGGTGAGQTRWITDNTTSQITVGQRWDTNPANLSTYMICDDAYRCVDAATNYKFFARETIGEP
jgi:hypothetical protein